MVKVDGSNNRWYLFYKSLNKSNEISRSAEKSIKELINGFSNQDDYNQKLEKFKLEKVWFFSYFNTE